MARWTVYRVWPHAQYQHISGASRFARWLYTSRWWRKSSSCMSHWLVPPLSSLCSRSFSLPCFARSSENFVEVLSG